MVYSKYWYVILNVSSGQLTCFKTIANVWLWPSYMEARQLAVLAVRSIWCCSNEWIHDHRKMCRDVCMLTCRWLSVVCSQADAMGFTWSVGQQSVERSFSCLRCWIISQSKTEQLFHFILVIRCTCGKIRGFFFTSIYMIKCSVFVFFMGLIIKKSPTDAWNLKSSFYTHIKCIYDLQIVLEILFCHRYWEKSFNSKVSQCKICLYCAFMSVIIITM